MIIIIIYLFCHHNTLGKQTFFEGKQIYRVLFKKFLLSDDDTVFCYSKCRPKSKSQMNCEGRKMTIGCKPKHQIIIYQATSYGSVPNLVPEGKLNDVCESREQLKCRRNVTKTVSDTCKKRRKCTIDFSSGQFENGCERERSLAVDVRYICHLEKLHPKVSPTKITTIKRVLPSKTASVFWLQNTYSVLFDNELMSKKKAECAMVFLLSLIFGSFIYLCLYLYRWWRKKSDDFKKESKYLLDSQNIDSTDATLQDKIADNQNTVLSQKISDNKDDEEKSLDVIYNKESNEDDFHEHNLLLLPHFNVTPEISTYCRSPHSCTDSLVPTICSIDTLSSKDVLLNEKQINYNKSHEIDVEQKVKTKAYLDDDDIADLRSLKSYTNRRIERYHTSNEYTNSPQTLQRLPHHRTAYYSTRSKLASTCSNKSINETSEDGMSMRSLDTRHKQRYVHKERQCFRHKPVLSEPREKIFITSDGRQYVLKNSRRKHHASSRDHHIHVKPKSAYSDNEALMKRKSYKHASQFRNEECISEHLHSSMYEMAEPRHRNDRSSLSSQCPSSIDGLDGSSRYVTTRWPRHKEFVLEESGYQSHGTATDSMCSSVFSTDREDGMISSPFSSVEIQRKPRRHKHMKHFTQPKDYKTVNFAYKNRDATLTSPELFLHECHPVRKTFTNNDFESDNKLIERNSDEMENAVDLTHESNA